jgi:peptidoglycan hydrolase-like protein with peptidoglycan-binding domain
MFRYFGPNKPMMNDRILRTDCIWRQQTFFNQARLLRLLSNQRNHTTFDLSQWPGLVTDGIFGPQTEKAAKAYQRAKLDEARASGHQNTVSPVDGIVGPKTWKSLTTDCITVLGVTKHAYSPTCFDVPRT